MTHTQPQTSGNSLAYGGSVVNVDSAASSLHTDPKTGIITIQFKDSGDPS